MKVWDFIRAFETMNREIAYIDLQPGEIPAQRTNFDVAAGYPFQFINHFDSDPLPEGIAGEIEPCAHKKSEQRQAHEEA